MRRIAAIGVTLVMLLSGTAVAYAATSPGKGPSKATIAACLKGMFLTGQQARSVHGSASPKVLAAFSALNKPARLPAGIDLGQELRFHGVTSYDPTHAALLRQSASGSVYLIPAQLATLPRPRACHKVPDADALISMRRTLQGSGPGVIAVETQGSSVESASAGSLSAINGYLGQPIVIGPGSSESVVVPDGVTQVQYMFAGNRARSVPVVNNLVRGPFVGQAPKPPKAGFTSAYTGKLKAWLAKSYPTAVRWLGSNGKPTVTHNRPRGTVTTAARAFRFVYPIIALATSTVSSGPPTIHRLG